MKRFALVASAAALLVVLVGVLFAQEGPGPMPGGPSNGTAPAWLNMDRGARDEMRIDTLLTDATLIGDERRAARVALEAKTQARQELTDALGKLRSTAENMRSSDEQLNQTIAAYNEALAKYNATVEEQDTQLAEKLCVRSRALCLALGIIDNGLGTRGGSSRRGGSDSGPQGADSRGGPHFPGAPAGE